MNEDDTITLMRQFDFTKPIRVEKIFEDDNVTNKRINDDQQNGPRLLENPSINEQDMLRIVAKNICSIVEAYMNYSQQFNSPNKETALKFRSIYFKTKYFFFQRCFPMSILLLRAQNRNDDFIRNFLKMTYEISTVRPDNIYDILGALYNDLLQWTELKMEKRTFVTEEKRETNRNTKKTPNKAERLPYKSRTELNSKNLNDKEKNNTDMLGKNTSSNPGSYAEEIVTNVEPNQLTPNETYIGNNVQDVTNRIQILSQTIFVSVVGPSTDTGVNYPSNTTEMNSKVNNISILHDEPVPIEHNYSSEAFNLQLEHVTHDNQENVQNNYLQNAKNIQSDNRKSENNMQTDKMIPAISKDFLALISHDILYINDPNKNNRPPGLCKVCGKETELICVACYNMYYCSGTCQCADWNTHRSICS